MVGILVRSHLRPWHTLDPLATMCHLLDHLHNPIRYLITPLIIPARLGLLLLLRSRLTLSARPVVPIPVPTSEPPLTLTTLCHIVLPQHILLTREERAITRDAHLPKMITQMSLGLIASIPLTTACLRTYQHAVDTLLHTLRTLITRCNRRRCRPLAR